MTGLQESWHRPACSPSSSSSWHCPLVCLTNGNLSDTRRRAKIFVSFLFRRFYTSASPWKLSRQRHRLFVCDTSTTRCMSTFAILPGGGTKVNAHFATGCFWSLLIWTIDERYQHGSPDRGVAEEPRRLPSSSRFTFGTEHCCAEARFALKPNYKSLNYTTKQ
jgi:hypothetical protein